MPRAVWNGIISFGLLNIPVSLMAAEKRTDLHFRMIDSRNNQPIRYERVNAETGEEVPWKDIVQAFEYEKGNYVVLSKDEIASTAPEGKESIDIEAFVERSEIETVYFEKPYYLLPGKKAEKGYVLLRELLREKDRVGIGHVIIRTRRYLCAVMPLRNILVLNLIRFHQEIVALDSFELPTKDLENFRLTKRELEMAGQLVDAMTTEWKPDDYIDDHRERLSALVEKRLASKQGLIHETAEHEEKFEHATTNVVDFMSLLEKSLKSGRRSAGSGETTPPGKSSRVTKNASAKASPKKAGANPKPAAKGASKRNTAKSTASKTKSTAKSRGAANVR
ncbi:MAG: Ku protein [Spongiibacteraceae bacterium]